MMKIWKLKQGADRRVRTGHPWVFSNELAESPRDHLPGEPVVLQDSKGYFVAAGYGNPLSLISFRATTFDSLHSDHPTSELFIADKLLQAWRQRSKLGYTASFRLCYGEGDFLPGLVVDRYLIEQSGKNYQVFAVQILTAGISLAIPELESFFKEFCQMAKQVGLCELSWSETAVVLRNDVAIRKLEGLKYEEPRVIKDLDALALNKVDILLHSPIDFEKFVPMTVDLVQGQKTGFFLDQAYNIKILCQALLQRKENTKIKVLDMCCYVGQWSTMIAHTLSAIGIEVETTLVDVSDQALAFAKLNSERQGAVAQVLKYDVMEDLPRLADKTFDIVIADPPAFIKAKKDIPIGKHAYLKLNTQAFRLVKSNGWVASCSCSGLFVESELMDVLRKAIQRDGRNVRCVAHGGHAPDHPVILAFEEGFYLKMFLHFVS